MDKDSGVLRISICKLSPPGRRLTGAAIGEGHAQQLRGLVNNDQPAEAALVLLDFRGVESASASYLKRLLNPFFAAAGSPDGFSQDVFPVAVNVGSSDLKEDLEDYLCGKGRVLIVGRLVNGRPEFECLLGCLDGAAAETFNELRELGETTAAELFERHEKRTTNQTAWNNRLAQLLELRIARRRREGRLWIYQPAVTN
jgi:hypothetical protein